MLSAQLVSIPSVHGLPTSPTPTRVSVVSFARIARANSLCFSWYWASDMWPSCQSPYISLPIDQNLHA